MNRRTNHGIGQPSPREQTSFRFSVLVRERDRARKRGTAVGAELAAPHLLLVAIEVSDLVGLSTAAEPRPQTSAVDAICAHLLLEEADVTTSGEEQEQLPVAERRLVVPRR
jgi:hypothetical protein